ALALLGLGLVNQLDSLFLQNEQELVELLGIDGVVGQVVVDLTVGQVTLFLARFEQGLEALVDLLHASSPQLKIRFPRQARRRSWSQPFCSVTAARAPAPRRGRWQRAAGFGVLVSRARSGAVGTPPGSAPARPPGPSRPGRLLAAA